MNILLAPDSFKESLAAADAAEAMARGAERAAPALGEPVNTDRCPISDGGEGFVEALIEAGRGRRRASRVPGPLGEPTSTMWGALDRPLTRAGRTLLGAVVGLFIPPKPGRIEGLTLRSRRRTAVIESASAVGLHLIPSAQRDPERTTTFGLGELIAEAIDDGCGRILLGLGGSATCDGGVGMARALGARFFDAHGEPITTAETPHPTGASLARIASVDVSSMDRRARDVEIIAAFDVDNPLFGPEGAACVFSPQKGASPEQVGRLDAGLRNLAQRCNEALLDADPNAPGAGAAGGLGFGLAAFCEASLRPGVEVVLDAVGFRNRLARADLMLTGEGRLDAQSMHGKACIGAAIAAAEFNVPSVALVGSLGEGWETTLKQHSGPLDAVEVITPGGAPEPEAHRRAAQNLETATERAVRKHRR